MVVLGLVNTKFLVLIHIPEISSADLARSDSTEETTSDDTQDDIPHRVTLTLTIAMAIKTRECIVVPL